MHDSDTIEGNSHTAGVASSGPVAPALNQRRSLLILAAIVAVAGGLRMVALDRAPPGITQDEAAHAYEAWCIRETGGDHYGERHPIFFRTFGDYHPGHYIYLLVPFQALFGVSVWSARLPAALFGTLAVPAVYLLASRLYGRRVGLFAAAFLAVSPWHMHISRLAFEVGLCATLLTAGLYLATGAGRKGCCITGPAALRLAASGLLLALVLWTYHAMRVVVPLLLIVLCIAYRERVARAMRAPGGRRGVIAFAIGFAIAIAPFAYATVTAYHEAWARADMLVGLGGGIAESAGAFARSYAAHFTPSFLLTEGDRSPIHSVPGFGELNVAYALLLPIGLWRAVTKRKSERFGLVLIAWILIAPIPAAATLEQSGHALRSAGVIPAYDLLAALGLETLVAATLVKRLNVLRVVLAVTVLAALWSAAGFGRAFFTVYPRQAALAFQSEWRDATDYVRRVGSNYDAVVLTTRRTNQVGMLYLFWRPVPPDEYFQTTIEIAPGQRWDQIRRVGPVYFWSAEEADRVCRGSEGPLRVLIAERPDVPVRGRPVHQVTYPNGIRALVFYEILLPCTNPGG